MTPLKPYLIRSIYTWIIDNQLTPHLLVDAQNPESVLPEDFIENGKIVLNIRPEATQGLTLKMIKSSLVPVFLVNPFTSQYRLSLY